MYKKHTHTHTQYDSIRSTKREYSFDKKKKNSRNHEFSKQKMLIKKKKVQLCIDRKSVV